MNVVIAIRKHVLRVSQAELARICGTTQATVSRWEAGELNPDINHLEKIRNEASARGVEWSDEWLFSPAPSPADGAAA